MIGLVRFDPIPVHEPLELPALLPRLGQVRVQRHCSIDRLTRRPHCWVRRYVPAVGSVSIRKAYPGPGERISGIERDRLFEIALGSLPASFAALQAGELASSDYRVGGNRISGPRPRQARALGGSQAQLDFTRDRRATLSSMWKTS